MDLTVGLVLGIVSVLTVGGLISAPIVMHGFLTTSRSSRKH